MVSPQIEKRLRGRYHAIAMVQEALEDTLETETDEDIQAFHDTLLDMEQNARRLVAAHPDQALYYSEQVELFREAKTWPLGE